MKTRSNKIQIVASLSFLLLYIDGDKVAWFMALFLPIVAFLTLGGAAEPIFQVTGYAVINAVISSTYLILVLLSVVYLFWSGIKGNPANKLSMSAGIIMFSIIPIIWSSASFNNKLSIFGLTIFILFNSLSLIANWKSLK